MYATCSANLTSRRIQILKLLVLYFCPFRDFLLIGLNL
jgi:hypothetical protein